MTIAVGMAIQNPTPEGMVMACPSNSSSTRSDTQSMTSGASARWSGSLLRSEYTLELFDQAVADEMEPSSRRGRSSVGIRLAGTMVSALRRTTAS